MIESGSPDMVACSQNMQNKLSEWLYSGLVQIVQNKPVSLVMVVWYHNGQNRQNDEP